MSDTTAAPVLTTEALTLTKTQRDKLVTLFVEGDSLKVRRVKGLLPYHRWTHDQVIAAMHESADRDGVPLVIDNGARSTMKRSMAIAKAWHATGADALVEDGDDTLDAVFTYLSQIADITSAGLERYAVPEAEREDAKVPEYTEIEVRPLPSDPDQFTPYLVDVPHGSGNGAIPAILAEYVTHRTKDDTGEIATDWLRRYRNAVRFANNERRRLGQDHDTVAADSRVGSGTGGNARGPRNQGGTGSKDTPAPAEKPAAPDHRQPGDKTARELTLREVIALLHKVVIDPATVITTKAAQEFDDMTVAYHHRYEIEADGGSYLPLPAPVVVAASIAPITATTAEADRQNAINLAPALPGGKDAMIRAILVELANNPAVLSALVPA